MEKSGKQTTQEFLDYQFSVAVAKVIIDNFPTLTPERKEELHKYCALHYHKASVSIVDVLYAAHVMIDAAEGL